MMEAAGSQEVYRVHSRSARRPDVSGSHSRSISDPIRSSWFLPSLALAAMLTFDLATLTYNHITFNIKVKQESKS